MQFRWMMISLFSLGMMTGCASTSSVDANPDEAVNDVRDPLESLNRQMWTVNYDYLDAYALRPATVGYMAVVPSPVRTGFANVVANLDEPANFVNGVLQGKAKSPAISLGRFVLNSTVGLVGFIDVASYLDLPAQDEDFGQTLAVWGVGNGPFLMVPGLGPTTARDLTGRVVDNLYFPMTWLTTEQSVAKFVISALSAREQLMGQEKLLNDSLDPYAFVKDAYFQRQQYKIFDGNPPQAEPSEEELLEFEE